MKILLFFQKLPEQEINFATFKEVLENRDHKQDTHRRINLLNNFKTKNFEDLVDNYTISVSVDNLLF